MRFSLAYVLVIGLSVLPAQTSALAQVPQPFSLNAVQNSTGALFLVIGSTAWPVVPDPIADDVLASIGMGDPSNTVDVDPRLAPPPTTRVVQASDGSLYVTTLGSRWNTGYPLLPGTIGDADLATLTLGPELDGVVPLTLATDVLPGSQQLPAAAGQVPAAPATPVGAPAATRSCDTYVPRFAYSTDSNTAPKAPCILLDVGQTVTSTLYHNPGLSEIFTKYGKWEGDCFPLGACELYAINLTRDKAYRLDLTTTN